MRLATRPGRVTAWIAIFAILLAALAPAVARAWLSPQQAMPWTEICSVAGPQGAMDAAPLPGSGQHDGALFKHCPFCLNHAGQFALPPPAHDLLPPAAAGSEGIPSSVAISVPRFIRVAAEPRAPPAIS
ncbi:MAG: DUF2946 family protein [Betaproteobacteria bacterium]|nr:DUF2946 family protein [Betaproteobacteria bacterium]